MNRPILHLHPLSCRARFLCIISVAIVAVLAAGCGGGGGSSGGVTGALFSSGDGIALASITFPKYTDLTGATKNPPESAPLTQQVVFTFTGKIQGDVSSGSIHISAKPGADYLGPDAALDKIKNIIPARGTFEVMNNVIVFTPYIPTSNIDFSTNAKLEQVPGLMPGLTYTVFVPVGIGGGIANLVNVDPTVTNPVKFKTVSPDLPSLFFSNHPALPPIIVSTDPANGVMDVPINTFSNSALPPFDPIVLTFNQPLDFTDDNLDGVDQNGNGVQDQNLFLEYAEPILYSAVDRTPTQPGFIAELNTTTNEFDLKGFTNHENVNVGLKSVVMTETHGMIGCSGTHLYDVLYTEASGDPPVCPLSQERELEGGFEVRGLAVMRGGELYALESSNDKLVMIDPGTGDVDVLGTLAPGMGGFPGSCGGP